MCHFFSLFAHLFTRIFHCELREMVRQKVDVPFGMAHFDLSYNLILFLGTTSLRWIDYIFSLALRFIYNCRGDFIFWRFWSFFLWSHEISTKLGHISFEEYAEAPSIHLFNMKVFIGWNFPISNIWMAFVPICATSSAKRIRHSTFASNSFINEK